MDMRVYLKTKQNKDKKIPSKKLYIDKNWTWQLTFIILAVREPKQENCLNLGQAILD